MGNKVMEPMDSPLMSAIPRLRPLQHMGRQPMQLLMDSLPQVSPSIADNFGSNQLGSLLRSLLLVLFGVYSGSYLGIWGSFILIFHFYLSLYILFEGLLIECGWNKFQGKKELLTVLYSVLNNITTKMENI